jgi:hypothetical protein
MSFVATEDRIERNNDIEFKHTGGPRDEFERMTTKWYIEFFNTTKVHQDVAVVVNAYLDAFKAAGRAYNAIVEAGLPSTEKIRAMETMQHIRQAMEELVERNRRVIT